MPKETYCSHIFSRRCHSDTKQVARLANAVNRLNATQLVESLGMVFILRLQKGEYSAYLNIFFGVDHGPLKHQDRKLW